jgi:hypothetical protein
MGVSFSVVGKFESTSATIWATGSPNHTLVLGGVNVVSTMLKVVGSEPFELSDVFLGSSVVSKLGSVSFVVVVDKVFRELLVEESEGFVQNPSGVTSMVLVKSVLGLWVFVSFVGFALSKGCWHTFLSKLWVW